MSTPNSPNYDNGFAILSEPISQYLSYQNINYIPVVRNNQNIINVVLRNEIINDQNPDFHSNVPIENESDTSSILYLSDDEPDQVSHNLEQ